MVPHYKKLLVDWTREILYSLRLCVVLVLQSRTRFLCSKFVSEYSEEEPSCNAEDNLRARHIVIEAWFKGY